MILCVTPNPAVDRTLVVPGFRLDKIHRPTEVISLPGGKGINVARALKALGEKPFVTGWIGGAYGKFIEAGLEDEGIQTAFFCVTGETRTCTSIYDPETGTMTEIYENGSPLAAQAVETFADQLPSLMEKCRAAVFSGSLPPGLSPKTYAGWILAARQAELFCALDGSGDPLKIGLDQGSPHLIKPNRKEFCRLVGMEEEAPLPSLAKAAREVARARNVIVLLSLGERGALAADASRVWQAVPPSVQSISAVGSGDAFLAGAVTAHLKGAPLEEMLRCGVAAGTANTLRLGAGCLDVDDYTKLFDRIKLILILQDT
jgi:tagatose 6-phosphate kinase